MTTIDLNGSYGPATPAHVAASAAALEDLAATVTTRTPGRNSKPLYVQVSLYDHGAFLNQLLFGFPVMGVPGTTMHIEPGPYVRDSGHEAYVIRSAAATSPDDPFVYGVVVSHPVPTQIEHTLATLAMLVSRQHLVSRGLTTDQVGNLDVLATESDEQTTRGVGDTLRTHGWRAAASAIAARSESLGRPLIVSYQQRLLSPSEIATRSPVLRRVYNDIPIVRSAIDRLATLLSQGLTVIGAGSDEVSSYARDLLDIGLSRTYLAQLARDAFVCGNGYLSFGSVPDEDLQLLAPESVEILDDHRYVDHSGDRPTIHTRVLHVRGARQYGSRYGVSALEPFVQIQGQRDLKTRLCAVAEAWNRPEVPEDARAGAAINAALAMRQLEVDEGITIKLLGGIRTISVIPPPNLYFQGQQFMSPAADALTIGSDAELGNAP
jgi:hypothetical protein